ncbi:hypothetical protein C0995_006990 [Termitomyces sp. Mi166|nr:hypothetical protein C0995_006990 [Termitomyces sp. Mi166\
METSMGVMDLMTGIDWNLERQKVNMKHLMTLLCKIEHKLGEVKKIEVAAAGEGSAAAESAGMQVSQAPAGYSNYMYRCGLDEEEDLGLLLHDFEQHLYVHGWDEELEILHCNFEEKLDARNSAI